MKSPRVRYLIQLLALAVAYVAAGAVVLLLQTSHRPLWLLWPASGVALAALLWGGYRLAPAITVASLLFTLNTADLPLAIVVVIAVGNTLQAMASVFLLNCLGGFDKGLSRLQDVLKLVVLAGLLGCTVSPTIATVAMCLMELKPWSAFVSDWVPWWVNNVLADLTVTPLLLTCVGRPGWDRRRLTAAVGLLVVTAAVSTAVFGGQSFRLDNISYPLTYAIVPLLIWMALGFGTRGAAACTFVVTAVAFVVSARRADTVPRPLFHESLLVLQSFLGVMAATCLALATAVTERQRAERQRRLVWQKSVDGMRLVDASGIILEVNDAFCRLVEMGPGQLIGKPFTLTYLEHNRERILQSFRTALERGRFDPYFEREVVLWNGRTIWVEHSYSLIQTPGQLPLVLSIFRDVGERKRSEEALRYSVDRYRSLFEANPHPMWVYDRDTLSFLAVNDAAVEHYGYSRDEFLAMKLADIRPPEEVPRMLEVLRRELPPVSHDGIWRHRKKDGTLIDVTTDSHEIHFGERRARVVLATDVTERLRAEQALRASEAKYRSLVENLEHSIFLKNSELCFVAANKRFCQGVGRSEAEIVGRTDYDLFPRRLAEKYRRDDERVLDGGSRLDVEEQTLIGGNPRTVRTLKTPVRDDTGRVVGVLGIFWDVTEQRNLEAQLRQAQKMEAVGQLAGGVAHDFNNLMTVILGNVGLLLARKPSDDPDRGLLSAVEHAGQRAAELTQQLLGFSRRTVLRPQPLMLVSCIEQTVGLLRRTIDPRIRIAVDCPKELWTVEADPSQVNQVLMNLCLNARDAMPDGGTLSLEAANIILDEPQARRLGLDARSGEVVRLRVSDTGQGMSGEVKARIFEPFFTTKEPGKGTGLGLAMVFGIIKAHGGWIDCHSEVARGTRFDVYLPRCRTETLAAPVEAPRPPVAVPVRGSETILVVDDEPMIRNLARHVLQRQGYQVLLADNGTQGVAIYERERQRIDLVILDLTMPQLSGHETLQLLRKIDPGVRVLFSSGYSAEQVTETEEDGVLGFLSKPYSPQEMALRVRAALDRGRTTQSPQGNGEPGANAPGANPQSLQAHSGG